MGLFSWLFGKTDEDLIKLAMDDTWTPMLCREEAIQLLNEWKANPQGLEFITYVREWKARQRQKFSLDADPRDEEDCCGGGCACDEADAAVIAETVADVVQTVAASLPESAPIQSEPVSQPSEPTPSYSAPETPSYSASDSTQSASSWSSDSGSSSYSSGGSDYSSSSWSSDSGSSSSDCGSSGGGGD